MLFGQSENYWAGEIPMSSATVASVASFTISQLFQILILFLCLLPFHIIFWPEGNSKILPFHLCPPQAVPSLLLSVMVQVSFPPAQPFPCLSLLSPGQPHHLLSSHLVLILSSSGSLPSTSNQNTGSVITEQQSRNSPYPSTAPRLLLRETQRIEPLSLLLCPWISSLALFLPVPSTVKKVA